MRHQIPLNEYELHEPIETGLSSNKEFIELRALRLWGASLNDLREWKNGTIDKSLLNLAVSFYIGTTLYENHKQDAVSIETINRSKKAKNK